MYVRADTFYSAVTNRFLTQGELRSGIGVSFIAGNLYRDLSVPANAMLMSNANETTERRGTSSSNVTNTRNFTVVTPSDYLWIMANFGYRERWDLKYQPSWERQFPYTPFLGIDGLFVVNSVRMDAADLGNVNFGFVASALGVNTPIQLIGAGVAHIMDHGGLPRANIRHFGDSPRCRHFTDMGRSWFRQGIVR